MTGSPPGESSGAACRFGAGRILPLADALAKEAKGAANGDDIEYIHRMRVASRRLRSALPLFKTCFAEKKYRFWTKEIRQVTRALGKARDADVQIAFLEKCIRKKNRQSDDPDNETSEKARSAQPAIEPVLLADIQKKRSRLQKQVIRTIESLEKNQVTEDLHETLQQMAVQPAGSRKRPSPYGIAPVAAVRINDRLAAMLRLAPFVHDPDAVAGHHAIRIAAKKLRYTMEVYAPVFPRGLAKPLARVKKIQTVLGDLHDYDVWIDQVTRMILAERSGARPDKNLYARKAGRITLLKDFLRERERERKQLYRRFTHLWDSLLKTNLWQDLQATLVYGAKKQFVPPVAAGDEPVPARIPDMAQAYPDSIRHQSLVSARAQELFDSLAPLHCMDRHMRLILSVAALQYDDGFAGNKKGCMSRIFDRILADEELPLPVSGRLIAGLVACGSYDASRPRIAAIHSLLTPAEQRAVRMLSVILGIACALDCRHADNVAALCCTIAENKVIITVTTRGSVPAAEEIAQASGYAGRFRDLFSRELVIA